MKKLFASLLLLCGLAFGQFAWPTYPVTAPIQIYKIVKDNGAGVAIPATNDLTQFIGITQAAVVTSSGNVPVGVGAASLVQVGSTSVSMGAFVTSDSSGNAVPFDPAEDGNVHCSVGTVVGLNGGGGAAGSFIYVHVSPSCYQTSAGGSGGSVTDVDGSLSEGAETVVSGAVSPITVSGTIRASLFYVSKTGAYSFADTDRGHLFLSADASADTYTLPTPSGSNFQNGWFACVKNGSTTAAVSLTPASPTTIDGLTTLPIQEHTTTCFNSDGTLYHSYNITPNGNNAANLFFASPATGSGPPSMRAIVAGDLPAGTTPVTSVFGRTGVVVAASGDYAVGEVTGAAPLASPGLTGTPTAPTAPTATNTTQLATTAYVQNQGYITAASAPVTSVFGRTGVVVAASGDYAVGQVTGAAPLASPGLTGIPTAPTATLGTSTTQLATTAFVAAAVPTSLAWSALSSAIANLTLSNGAFTSTFNQTSNVAWLWYDTASGTSGSTNASPLHEFAANYYNGTSSTQDTWSFGSSLLAGTNGASFFSIAHTGSTGEAAVEFPSGLGKQAISWSNTTSAGGFGPAASGVNGTCIFGSGNCVLTITNGTVVGETAETASFQKYLTLVNCSNGASPAVCTSASAGSVAVPTGATSTLVVDTTQVLAGSEIFLQADDSLTISGVTCNTTLATLTDGYAVTARTPGTSFTISAAGTIMTNPVCLSFHIVN